MAAMTPLNRPLAASGSVDGVDEVVFAAAVELRDVTGEWVVVGGVVVATGLMWPGKTGFVVAGSVGSSIVVTVVPFEESRTAAGREGFDVSAITKALSPARTRMATAADITKTSVRL